MFRPNLGGEIKQQKTASDGYKYLFIFTIFIKNILLVKCSKFNKKKL